MLLNNDLSSFQTLTSPQLLVARLQSISYNLSQGNLRALNHGTLAVLRKLQLPKDGDGLQISSRLTSNVNNSNHNDSGRHYEYQHNEYTYRTSSTCVHMEKHTHTLCTYTHTHVQRYTCTYIILDTCTCTTLKSDASTWAIILKHRETYDRSRNLHSSHKQGFFTYRAADTSEGYACIKAFACCVSEYRSSSPFADFHFFVNRWVVFMHNAGQKPRCFSRGFQGFNYTFSGSGKQINSRGINA